VSLTVKDSKKHTPLDLAFKRDNPAITKLLLERYMESDTNLISEKRYSL
jgi:ankyrin repeat protein